MKWPTQPNLTQPQSPEKADLPILKVCSEALPEGFGPEAFPEGSGAEAHPAQVQLPQEHHCTLQAGTIAIMLLICVWWFRGLSCHHAQNASPLVWHVFAQMRVYRRVQSGSNLSSTPTPSPPVSRVAVCMWGWFRFRAWFRVKSILAYFPRRGKPGIGERVETSTKIREHQQASART